MGHRCPLENERWPIEQAVGNLTGLLCLSCTYSQASRGHHPTEFLGRYYLGPNSSHPEPMFIFFFEV